MDKFVTRSRAPVEEQEVELGNLPADPGLRIPISDYHPNLKGKVRRAYLQKGACQPSHNFKKRKIGNLLRRFNLNWFNEYKLWLGYSVEKEAAFCLYCYLFKSDNKQGGDAFVKEGFDAWNKKERLDLHVGGPNSGHNQAQRKCEDLMKQNQYIDVTLNRHSEQIKNEYRIRLGASVDCLRFLLRQGIALRGHDESNGSINQGNFLEILKFLAAHNKEINGVVGKNAPGNLKISSPDIQHDIVNASAVETLNYIIHDLGDDLFAILIDESCDISVKEQMIVILRYVDKRGHVIERFIGIAHVPNTNAASLKVCIDSLFAKHGLSISKIRGQGYDGASNMRGEFNGLKSLIMRENESAHYIHCFAHQLQLTLVAIAKNNVHVGSLFNMIANLVNVVGASCKRRDILRDRQAIHIYEALAIGELASGHGLNQETTLKRALNSCFLLEPANFDFLTPFGFEHGITSLRTWNNL
nr:PREDICTED: zinc finger MYM-type protein 1-like [Daucus carota subsp. sativus]